MIKIKCDILEKCNIEKLVNNSSNKLLLETLILTK